MIHFDHLLFLCLLLSLIFPACGSASQEDVLPTSAPTLLSPTTTPAITRTPHPATWTPIPSRTPAPTRMGQFDIPATSTSFNPPAAAQPSAAGGESATVDQVIDGDTIDVQLSGSVYRVRYIGVNTPERDEACYDDATQANAAVVAGQTVTLVRDVSDTDQYGRLLRYVFVGDTFVNGALVADGYAEARRYPPDTTYATYLQALEDDARAANIGCHPYGVFASP